MNDGTPDIQKVIECLCSLGEMIQEVVSGYSESEVEAENNRLYPNLSKAAEPMGSEKVLSKSATTPIGGGLR